ncbi:MAG TPA: hypothetical protein VE269_03080, partial [Gaiellaceae bacterium]|nr:hypothetical protein [Gaiellaceae bacterium]
KYLTGTYHEQPITVDGRYFPDGGFLFDFHVLWAAGRDVASGVSPYPFVYPAPAALLIAPFRVLPWKVPVVARDAAAAQSSGRPLVRSARAASRTRAA